MRVYKKKPAAEKMSVCLSVVMTKGTHKALEAAALKAGVSKTELARNLIMTGLEADL